MTDTPLPARGGLLGPALLIALAALGGLVVVWALRPTTYQLALTLDTEPGLAPATVRVGGESLGSTPLSLDAALLAELSDPALVAGGWPPRAPEGARGSSSGSSWHDERLIERVSFETAEGATLLYLRVQEQGQPPELHALSIEVRDAGGRLLPNTGAAGSEDGGFGHTRIEERLTFGAPAGR